MTEAVSYEVSDRVAHITIEREEKRNAMSLEVFDQLGEQARRAGADPDVGAVMLSGRGGVFSSGIDLGLFAGTTDRIDRAFVDRLQASFTAFEELDVPSIAAIEGYCFGGGFQLAIACHLRAVAPDARLAMMEARWGLIPDLGGTWRLPRLVGLGRATELTLTARSVPASEAIAMGLAEVALPSHEPRSAAHEMAARLASGPGGPRRAPRLLRENLARPRPAALDAEAVAQLECLAGPDFTEAVTASLEGREPDFVGR